MRRSDKRAVGELFGKDTVIAVIDLPSNLDTLARRLPNPALYPASFLISGHTLLPYYAPFLPPQRLRDVSDDMLGDNGPRIHMRMGIMAGQVPQPTHLKVCRRCVAEDRAQYGECYWHREQQAPGVLLCAKHGSVLVNTTVLMRHRRTRYHFITAESVCKGELKPAIDSGIPLHFGLLRSISAGVSWLTEQQDLCPGLDFLQRRYLEVLSELGYVTDAGRVRAEKLGGNFRERYPVELLRLLGCDVSETVSDNWLARMLRKPDGLQQPLRHLVLMDFLGVSPEQFFNKEQTSDSVLRPIYNLNPYPAVLQFGPSATQHGNVDRENEVLVTPANKITDAPCSARWDTTKDGVLRLLWSQAQISLREKARRLGADPVTVKRHALRLGLDFPEGMSEHRAHLSANTETSRKASMLGIREEHRARWLHVVAQNDGVGAKKLRQQAPNTYAWLYRQDKQWLKGHLPEWVRATRQASRVDWPERDKALSKAVRHSAEQIASRPGRPSQITVASIGREVGQLALIQQHLDKMPLTRQLLDSVCETGEEFTIRRLLWAWNYYCQLGQFPSLSGLVRKAGASRYMSNVRVLTFINDLRCQHTEQRYVHSIT